MSFVSGTNIENKHHSVKAFIVKGIKATDRLRWEDDGEIVS